MTSIGTTRRLALLGIVLALALPAVLMACGGDEPDADGERAATPRTQATETASTPVTGAATATTAPGAAPTATAAPRATATRAPLLNIGRGSAETDREALVALFNATDGENWARSGNWLSDAPLDEWDGVLFTDDNGRVTVLDLRRNQLSGEIPPELGGLANLESLFLSRNQLSGEIPLELGNLSKLYAFHLDDNQLTGEIPSWLDNLADLSTLGLAGNQLSGEIPPELGSLANLRTLNLSHNQLTGEIPPELGGLANLERLYLNHNQLSGCVPSSLQDQLDMINSNLGGLPFCP